MDQKPNTHHNRFPKKSDAKPSKKQKPLKVVYISNPIRVTTSADGFRGVVQELTGRDSDIADILARQPLIDHPVLEPCDALIPARQLPPELGEGDNNSFKLMPERIAGTEEYFAGLLPLSLLFDME
ncbi:sigma factor binding protein 1, chloroplastic-like [Dendrobium catenatum]|uniref:Sigma factor binding protein 1, chloroplastic n=1 Tax=Dendrobium catenatum TaxID=906689 RepID=A0A2I0WL51_9ASPA|nr:sigma factor binding protein 1, chloroplastic-like [Dendrobium catenatum]PKU76387.1 Sigma factor binding protein 1, chloroplastic [Dendrobium catenatum]